MSDIVESIAGNKMLQLKQEMAQLRQLLANADETAKPDLRRQLREKETYYNILAERQRLSS